MDRLDINWNRFKYIGMPIHVLNQLITKPCKCVEFGVWHGWFADELLKNRFVTELCLVDMWKITEYWNPYIKSPITIDEYLFNGLNQKDKQSQLDYIYKDICNKYKNDSRVTIIRDYELNVIDRLKEFDFVHIDGSSDDDERFTMFEKCYRKLSVGGIIASPSYTLLYQPFEHFYHLYKHNLMRYQYALGSQDYYVVVKKK